MKISANHRFLRVTESVFGVQPFNLLKGMFSAYVAYPLAECMEHRDVKSKLFELRKHYRLSYAEREVRARTALVDTLRYAGLNVPYYRDLFTSVGFDAESIYKDLRYLDDLPFLTKEIIREQGDRMHSRSLSGLRHHICKTGGSTGVSCHIAYDQPAADYSSAVTLYAREAVGNRKWRSELHFACRFPDEPDHQWPTRESFKCLAMNRSNIFFDRLDDQGLEEIWQTLQRRRPFMVHAHPSTIYALACYIERAYGKVRCFNVFESSGELLEPYMRETIARALCCRVVDRYGLAELGVMAYELAAEGLQVLDSEGWAESRQLDGGEHELVFTGFRNRLMPLIRYATGDLARVEKRENGVFLTEVVGRIHDMVHLSGVVYPTHTIQDILDHRVGGIQEFQIDVRGEKPMLRIVPEAHADTSLITQKIEGYWPGAMTVEFVDHGGFIRVGHRAKFRHVVTA